MKFKIKNFYRDGDAFVVETECGQKHIFNEAYIKQAYPKDACMKIENVVIPEENNVCFELDSSPLPTDFTDLNALMSDMESFAKEHPSWIVLQADDPGINHKPPRVPRMGWVSYDPDHDEDFKMWTIKLADIKKWHKKQN